MIIVPITWSFKCWQLSRAEESIIEMLTFLKMLSGFHDMECRVVKIRRVHHENEPEHFHAVNGYLQTKLPSRKHKDESEV